MSYYDIWLTYDKAEEKGVERHTFIEECIGNYTLFELSKIFDMEEEDEGSVYQRAYEYFGDRFDCDERDSEIYL